MKHKVFVLLPVAALLVAGVTPALAKSISQKQFKQHIMMRGEFAGKHDEELAKVLGITVDDLKARIATGKNPLEIAQDLGISEADFKKKQQEQAVANIKAHLAEEVAAGTLTQDEADQEIARLEKDVLDGKFALGPMGKGLGFRGGPGMVDKHKAHLQEMVVAGKLTQAEADAKIATMEAAVQNGIFMKMKGPGPGMMGGGRHK